jgi:pilus assembly protein Flp/PilA
LASEFRLGQLHTDLGRQTSAEIFPKVEIKSPEVEIDMAGSLQIRRLGRWQWCRCAVWEVDMNMVQSFINDDSGADLIEYALLAGLIALAAVATLTTVGTNITGLYTKISTKIAGITLP